MLKTPNARMWLGASMMLALGLSLGCRHQRPEGACSTCKDAVVAHAGQKTATTPSIAIPTELPVRSGPVVKNERYLPPTEPKVDVPAPQNQIVITQKPNYELPPVIVVEKTPSAVAPIPIPAPADQAPVAAAPAVDKPIEYVARRSYPDITARAEFNHAPDYTWLIGELHHNPNRDEWRVRFASIDNEDRYGGSVTLNGGRTMMRSLKSGMMVRVQGMVVDKESRDPAPQYRVIDIAPLN